MPLIELNTNPSRRDLAWFGPLLVIFGGLVGACFYHDNQNPTVAYWIWSIAAGLATLFFLVPPLRRPIFVGWVTIVFPIGWVISHLILGITYYLVITPIGLVMRLVGHDPLHRRFDRTASSYWIAHKPVDTAARYFRQS